MSQSSKKRHRKLRILFLQNHLLNESLPLTECLALLRSRGYSCALLVENEEQHFYKKIARASFDLLAISADIGNEEWLSATLSIVRKISSKPILLMGSLPTLAPQKAAAFNADFYLTGEVEQSFPSLLEQIEQNNQDFSLAGVYPRKSFPVFPLTGGDPIKDLDSLPLPDREAYFRYPALGLFPLKKFVAGRGCPLHCAFCYISPLKKLYHGNPHLRLKSPSRVIEEIQWVKKRYPLKFVHFSDDVFGWNKKWLLEFCSLYAKKISLPFDINTIAILMDDLSLDALSEAKCKGIAIGIEVAHENIRVNLLGKPILNSQILNLSRRLRKKKICLITYNMIAIPNLNKRADKATLSFNRTLKPKVARVQIAYPMPGTDLAPRLSVNKNHKRLLHALKTSFPFFVRHKWVRESYWNGQAYLKMLSPIFACYAMWQEKRFYNLPLAPCIRLYRKTGGMTNRTKNINLSLP